MLFGVKLEYKCTLADWNNKIIMENLYELYLKRNIRRSVEWHQIGYNKKAVLLNYILTSAKYMIWIMNFRKENCERGI